MDIAKPYLLFLGDVGDQLAAKTAHGIVDWRPDWCVGQLRLAGCTADCGLPDLDIAAAARLGARTLVVGVVNPGGVLGPAWVDVLVDALEAGLDLAAGMHTRLAEEPRIARAARDHGRKLHDVRFADGVRLKVGNGRRRSGLRLLTVGTDCSVGKKYTALALARALEERGCDVDFRATGQTGVLISGRGLAVDAVVSDFLSGAAEYLSPAADDSHWDVIEGQGSLLHPSFAGVSLGLLHGSQPDAFVVCHEPTRARMRGVDYGLPSIAEIIDATTTAGRRTNPAIACAGISLNTSALTEAEARATLEATAREHGLACVDPLRGGVGTIVDGLLERFGPEPRARSRDEHGDRSRASGAGSE